MCCGWSAAILRRVVFFGPAFVAATGYIDPGNFATNIQAGAEYGNRLLWVVVWSNLIAVFVQLLSSKLGLATGLSLVQTLGCGIAAAVFHAGNAEVAGIETAYKTLEPALGNFATHIFGLSLVIAGLASTVVGTLAGQEVMQGFVGFRTPVHVRRAVTMIPSFFVILAGFDLTPVLVLSQVVLSFGVALALVPLVIFTSRPAIMGDLVNGRTMRILAWLVVAIAVMLNVVLVAAG